MHASATSRSLLNLQYSPNNTVAPLRQIFYTCWEYSRKTMEVCYENPSCYEMNAQGSCVASVQRNKIRHLGNEEYLGYYTKGNESKGSLFACCQN